jgi:Holliday junction resolvase RusA-like endonuclease
MIRINIKPMSVNDAWKGRRFKTKKYTDYSKTLLMILPKVSVPNTQLEINFIFGISSCSDIDNPLKLIIDIFQKKYKFDDKKIMKLIVQKNIVKKGQEYFMFDIKPYIL